MTRELVVLGTASQVPTRHRNHNGYQLRWDDEVILFDPGEGGSWTGTPLPAGCGVVAASSAFDTGFGFGYFPNQHVGATSWFLIAAGGVNPYRVAD